MPKTVNENAHQEVEQQAYVPTYKVKPEFKQAVFDAIGKFPFNQINSVMQAVNVEVMDHNTLTQIINVLGNFPYQNVFQLLTNINSYVEQEIPEEEVEAPSSEK